MYGIKVYPYTTFSVNTSIQYKNIKPIYFSYKCGVELYNLNYPDLKKNLDPLF